jgi:hypothetical protein
MKPLIDGVDEPDALREQLEGADAAVTDAMNAVGDFVMDVGGGQDGPMAADGFGFVQPTLDTALVSVELMSYFSVHSKSLSAGGDVVWSLHSTPQKLQGISSFSKYTQTKAWRLRLVKG